MSVKVGDDIRFTGESDYFDRGAIYTVTDLVGYGNIIVDNPGGPNGIYYGEYEVITKEADTMEKAQVGDLIRIVNVAYEAYKNGEIYEVNERHPDDDSVIITLSNGDDNLVYDNQYVIHRKAGEEDSAEEVATDVGIQQGRPDSSHYHKGSVDVWKFADENFSAEEVSGFHRINAIKYLTRYGKKGGNNRKDLEKAIVSIEKLIAIYDAKSTQG